MNYQKSACYTAEATKRISTKVGVDVLQKKVFLKNMISIHIYPTQPLLYIKFKQ
jgi:hypothetical protein